MEVISLVGLSSVDNLEFKPGHIIKVQVAFNVILKGHF